VKQVSLLPGLTEQIWKSMRYPLHAAASSSHPSHNRAFIVMRNVRCALLHAPPLKIRSGVHTARMEGRWILIQTDNRPNTFFRCTKAWKWNWIPPSSVARGCTKWDRVLLYFQTLCEVHPQLQLTS
jgi:hypothetical protein